MKTEWSLVALQQFQQNTVVDHLGIEFIELTDTHLVARMPVDHRTRQPFGVLHGGASAVLAETLGSIASYMRLDNPERQRAVGIEINANHVRAATEGWVYGKVTPLHVGRSTHIWDIRITDEQDRLVCVSRLTVAVVER